MKQIITFLSIFIFSQGTEPERIYLRKSISYFDGILLGKEIVLPEDVSRPLLSGLKKTLILERFDYNPIPSHLQERIQEEVKKIDSLTVDDLSTILEKVFLPEIIKILEAAKETRAREFVSQEERVNFLTTKAKEIGVTADDIEKVMNAAYIYVPFITSYEIAKEGNLITVSLEGGIIWYNVAMRFSPPKVIPITKKSSRAFGLAREKEFYLDFTTNEKLTSSEFANHLAIKTFLKNIQVLTRSIPDFRLSSDVFSVFRDEIYFKLGLKEGVRVDDKFDIVEFYEDESGLRKPKTVGCALVTKVADNRKGEGKLYSQARSFIGKGEVGMVLIERPRLPVDILFRYVHFSNNWGLDLEFDFNIGRYLNVPQLFLPVNLTFSPIGGYAGEKRLGLSELGFGLVKKFYFRRIAFGGEGKLKIGDGFGSEFKGLLEFWLFPDLILGGKYGYSFGGIEGFVWGIHLGYNPPTLPFDPLETLRGLLGI